jgi:hypothetical protein
MNRKFLLRFTHHQKCNSLCSQSIVRYKSWCTGLVILLFLQFFDCNLDPGIIHTDLGFLFAYNCFYLLYMSAGLRCLPCISPQEPRNTFLEISHCRTLLKSVNIPILFKIGQHEHFS